jgi:hypothetical protein
VLLGFDLFLFAGLATLLFAPRPAIFLMLTGFIGHLGTHVARDEDRRRCPDVSVRWNCWNTAWFGHPDDRLRQRLADLETALEAEGRDPATLRRTVGMHVLDPDVTSPDDGNDVAFGGSVDELGARDRRLRGARLRRRHRRAPGR